MQIYIFKSPQLITTPQNTTKMPSEQYKKEESRIQKALESLKKNPKQKITSLAREFDINYYQLRRRVLGSASQLNR
jgi:hypothetical protein